MKKLNIIAISVLAMFAILFFACNKKSKDNSISPTYKSESGTGGNPNVGNATQTGTVPVTNPASNNSSFNVGGSGWLNPSCASTGSLTLKGINGSIEVTLSFFSAPTTGTYAVSTSPGAQNVQVTVKDAPNQPAGIMWYGKTGVVSVNTNSTSINAVFSGVQCVQQAFNFPVVTVSGNVGCN